MLGKQSFYKVFSNSYERVNSHRYFFFSLFRNRQKRKVQTKRRLGMKKIEVPDDIANDSGLEKLDKIEKFASKMKMNRTQIKGVIRGICETPELLHLALKQSEPF